MNASADARVLHERAVALARAPEPETATASEALVEFALGTQRYAIAARYVDSVQVLRELTPLPGAPAFIAGLVNLQGLVLLALDLKRWLHLPAPALNEPGQVLVIGDGSVQLGLLVDRVEPVQLLPGEALHAVPATLVDLPIDCLRGVTMEQVVVLDGARLCADPRLRIDHGAMP